MGLLIDRLLYPELNLILWDRHDRFIDPKVVFEHYEIRWRYIDHKRFSDSERRLIHQLMDKYGNGLVLSP